MLLTDNKLFVTMVDMKQINNVIKTESNEQVKTTGSTIVKYTGMGSSATFSTLAVNDAIKGFNIQRNMVDLADDRMESIKQEIYVHGIDINNVDTLGIYQQIMHNKMDQVNGHYENATTMSASALVTFAVAAIATIIGRRKRKAKK